MTESQKPRVLLVVPTRPACGVSDYAGNLAFALALRSQVGLTVLTELRPEWVLEWDFTGPTAPQIIHVIHHPNVTQFWGGQGGHWYIHELKKKGLKIVFTLIATIEGMDLSEYEEVDELVALEPGIGRAVCIPHGVPRPLNAQPLVIPKRLGTFGLAAPWKRWELLEEACKRAGWEFHPVEGSAFNELSRDDILRELASCQALAFFYSGANTGVSSAITYGIAAGRPIIVSLPSVCRQFRDWWHCDPEGFHWVESLDNIVYLLRVNQWRSFELVQPQKYHWGKIALAYINLYQRLLTK